jgi:hypothetical protein
MRWLTVLFTATAALGAGLSAGLDRGPTGLDPSPANPTSTSEADVLAQVQAQLPFPIPTRLSPGTLSHRDDICRVSDLVMVASVIGRHEYIEERGRVRTPRARVRLFAERVVLGTTPPHMEIIVTGGMVGQYFHPGTAPELAVGQRYLMLLRKHPKWGWRILGGGAGAVRLRAEARLPGNAQLEMMWEQACTVPLPVPQRTFAQDR